jgi:AcrR family transcriptional regulator
MDTKEKIILKASEMFLNQGYDNSPMSQIAKELGFSKAGLYHHYPSKESLLFDVIDYMNESNFVPIYNDAKKISDPGERLIYFLRRFTEIMATDGSSRIAVHEAKNLEAYHLEKVKKSWRMTYDLLKGAISEMQAAGKAKDINSGFAAFAAIGMCSWVFYWFDHSRRDSWEELSETFVKIFMCGITKTAE